VSVSARKWRPEGWPRKDRQKQVARCVRCCHRPCAGGAGACEMREQSEVPQATAAPPG